MTSTDREMAHPVRGDKADYIVSREFVDENLKMARFEESLAPVYLKETVCNTDNKQNATCQNKTCQQNLPHKEKSFNGQDFHRIRQDLSKNRKLFEDNTFPRHKIDLKGTKVKEVIWKRPKEIADAGGPKFLTNGPNSFEAMQGQIHNRWCISAINLLATRKDLIFRVVPQDQGFADVEYAGIFHFHFWQYGSWYDVVIDDFLPVDSENKLVFAHTEQKNDYWIPLLEKAYAKLYGSYTNLVNGSIQVALVDFTGGLAFGISMKNKTDPESGAHANVDRFLSENKYSDAIIKYSMQGADDLLHFLHDAIGRGSLISAEIFLKRGSELPLIRLRHHQGEHGTKWKGSFSDSSNVWTSVTDADRDEIIKNIPNKCGGEFWMPFPSFIAQFDWIDMCHLNYMAVTSMTKCLNITWGTYEQCHGAWKHTKVHFLAPLPTVVSLLNVDKERKRDMVMAFILYKLPEAVTVKMTVPELGCHKPLIALKHGRMYRREVSIARPLTPGHYLIIPSAEPHGLCREFMIRVFSDAPKLTIKLVSC